MLGVQKIQGSVFGVGCWYRTFKSLVLFFKTQHRTLNLLNTQHPTLNLQTLDLGFKTRPWIHPQGLKLKTVFYVSFAFQALMMFLSKSCVPVRTIPWRRNGFILDYLSFSSQIIYYKQEIYSLSQIEPFFPLEYCVALCTYKQREIV